MDKFERGGLSFSGCMYAFGDIVLKKTDEKQSIPAAGVYIVYLQTIQSAFLVGRRSSAYVILCAKAFLSALDEVST